MQSLKTLDDVVALTKMLLTKTGHLDPTLIFIGSKEMTAKPLPDAEDAVKLSLCEALGYSLTQDPGFGALQQLFLISEGWYVRRHPDDGIRGALQPKYAPDRVECVMISHYDLTAGSKDMILYDQVRDAAGAVSELKRTKQPDDQQIAESPPMEAIIRGYQRGLTALRV